MLRIARVLRRLRLLGAIATMTFVPAGCDRSAPTSHGAGIAEPTSPMRSPEQRGAVPEQLAVVDYAIDASLDPEAHEIRGLERITWRNRSQTPVSELHLHLYMNAFSAEDTAWMRQGRGSHRGEGQGTETPWGYVQVESIRMVDAAGEASGQTRPLVPGSDPTVATVALPEPVAPGAQVQIDVDFITRLPQVFARTGYAGDFVMAGQWFPKVAVLEPDGTWSNHVFTFHSEFYADFGDYKVVLDVPESWVVGATGIRVATEAVAAQGEASGRNKFTYVAQNVHDFAWTASPNFVEHVTLHEGIRIRQLMPPALVPDADIHLAAQVEALDSMQPRFGAYPWSQITIVHPPAGAEGAGGMEYPTLYTTSPLIRIPRWIEALGFAQRLDGRFTTVHEFGHQYFQGLLASNEFAAPWLDEGMNSFSNALVLEDSAAGDWVIRVAGHPLDAGDLQRLDMRRIEGVSVVDLPADAFDQVQGLYGRTVYRKASAAMHTLRNLAGAERFDAALGRYARTYRFAHPTADDLFDVLVAELGGAQDPTEGRLELGTDPDGAAVTLSVKDYLHQAFRTPAWVGFAVRSVRNRTAVGNDGWHRGPDGTWDETTREDTAGNEAVVVVERAGDLVVPVEIEVVFEDGEHARFWWSAASNVETFVFADRRVARVTIDPSRHHTMESKRLDNHRYADRDHPPTDVERDVDALAQAAVLMVAGGIGP